ncbi:MAG TPA: hypothetical protein VLG49_04430, partial [Rhabdochlamydiaceae bacterium]|nr:hypothetical protein [Rhabdochlamydiaceae bacterium]
PPAPTQIDSIIFTANFFLQQQPNAQTVDAKLLSGWINAMQTSTKGSQSTQADIINTDWFKNTFQNAKQDVYMQYVGVSSTTLKQIFDLLKAGTPPKPTIIDEYELAATYALNQQFQANDKVLFLALIQIYQSLGSNASISQLQQAGTNYINQNQSAWSSSTYDARQAFTALTSNGSQNLFNTLNAVIARIAAQTPGSASFNMAQYLVELIGTNIPYSVDQTAFGNQLIQLFTNADFYAQFPGVTTDDIQWVNTLIGQQVFSVTPTQGDQIIFEVYQFLQSLDPKSSDYQFVFNFLKTCQSWGSSFTTASVQNWFNTTYPPNMDIFMANPDIGGDLVKLLSNITGQTLTPTANDQLYKQAYDWSQSLPSVSPDAALAGALSAYLLSIGSTGAYDPGWAKKIFDGNFANYPGISVNGIIEFCKIAGLQISGLDPYRILIAQWESSFQPNTPQYRFAAAILSEITTLGPTGTVDQLTSWLQGLLNDGPGKLDAYCQFPGLTQQDIEALTGILPKITVPPPTILDGIYNQYAALLASDNNPQDIALIKSFLNAIQAMGNMAGANQGQVTQALQGWFNNLFSHDDPYLQYPDASPNLISMLYGTVGKADPGPTYVDQQYKIAYDYTHSLPVNATADIKLMNAMLQEMQAVGSYGNFINVSYWALGIVKTNFADFPGVTQATKTEFQTIAGIDISQILAKALQWQQSLSGNQNSGAYKLATALVKEIQSLGTAGTIVDVENWFSSTFGGAQDPYMQNPGPPPLGQSDLQVLYNIILIGTAPPPTVMDARFEEVWNFTLGVSGQNNINLMNALLNEIRSLGSNGSLLQLAQWGSRFAYESPLYRAADPSIKQAFNKLARQG